MRNACANAHTKFGKKLDGRMASTTLIGSRLVVKSKRRKANRRRKMHLDRSSTAQSRYSNAEALQLLFPMRSSCAPRRRKLKMLGKQKRAESGNGGQRAFDKVIRRPVGDGNCNSRAGKPN
jgi:hypothetical protein